jgi:hypothetical protein
MSLLALQGGFRDLLLDESAVTNTAYAAGLSVYRNAYRERLVEYLRKTSATKLSMRSHSSTSLSTHPAAGLSTTTEPGFTKPWSLGFPMNPR